MANRFDTDIERGEDRGWRREGDWGREGWNREGRYPGREGEWGRYGREGEWGRGEWGRMDWGPGPRRESEYYGGYGREGWGGEGRYGRESDWGRGRYGGYGYGGYGYGEAPYGREGRYGWEREPGRSGWSGQGSYGESHRPGYSGYGWQGRQGEWGRMGAGEWGRQEWPYRGEESGYYTGRGPKNYHRSDQRIEEDVCERLTQHPNIDASNIEVKVQNSEVTLSGTVDERHAKRLAEDVAENVTGVREVHNNIHVQHEGQPMKMEKEQQRRAG